MLIADLFSESLRLGLSLPAMLAKHAPGAVGGMHFLERDGGARDLPYAALCEHARQGGARLARAGLRPGDAAILCCDDEYELVLAFWAVLFAGGVAVPLTAPASYGAGDEGVHKLVAVYSQLQRQCQAHPLLVSDLDFDALERIDIWRDTIAPGRMLRTDALFDGSDDNGATLPLAQDGDALAMLMFSSGSTGEPKGVRLSHRQLLTNMLQICERSAVTSEDRSLSWLPLTHDMGLVLFHLCHTLAGIAQYKSTPLSFARDPGAFLRLIGAHRASLLGMPNFGFDQLLRVPDDALVDLASVRVIYNGAEPIDPQLCRRFAARFARFGLAPGVISPGWGIAEASVAASAFPQAQLRELGDFPSLWLAPESLNTPGAAIVVCDAGTPGAREIAALGPPMAGMRVRALDDDGKELPPSHLGHLELAGPNVSDGYFAQADQAWCASGDIGFLHHGIVYLSGRAKDVLFINGRNHYANDVELALCRQLDWPANQLAVVGTNHGGRERVVVFFRLARGMDQAQQTDRLRGALEALLAYPVAGAIGVAALPKTSSGKIRRFALRQALERGEYDHALTAGAEGARRPLTASETRLLELLRDIVPDFPDRPDPELPLSRYGLDSVGFMQLAFRAGRQLQPHALLQAASLARIALLLDAAPPDILPAQAAQESLRRVPLTARQDMLWSAWLLAPSSAAYHENYWLALDAALDPQAWLAAARAMLARHPMLNAVIDDDGATPMLALRDEPAPDLGIDWAGHAHEAALAAMAALGQSPFDLRRGPLCRLRLLKATAGHWYVFVSAHHIVVDGWSLQLLMSQIFSAYAGAAPPPEEAGLWFQPQAFEPALLRAWRERILAAEAIQLPLDAHGPSATVVWRRALGPGATWALLKAQAQGLGSQFTLLAGALLVLLARLASVQRPLLATVAAGRADAPAARRVGYFALTLPLTVEIDEQAGFDALLAQIEPQRLALLADDTPDLAALEGETGPSIAQGVRVVYVHQNMPALAVAGGVTILDQGRLRGQARADLYLNSSWQDGADGQARQLCLDWEYDGGRFSAAQIAAYADLFEHVLGQVLAAPSRPLARLDLLSPRQRALWRPYQDTAHAVDFEQSVLARFERAARLWPRHTALSDGDARHTYGELAQKVDALCHRLAQAGLTQGARVCLLTGRSADYVIALLASLKLGAVAVPLDPALPRERITQITAASGARLMLTTPGVADPGMTCRTLCFCAAELGAGPAYHGPRLADTDPAYLIFTSGSTGASKGVLNTHRCLVNLVDWVCRAFAYRAGETICQFAPFSFDVSIAEILPSLCAGLHIHVLPDERRKAPELYLETIAAQHVNIATVTPAYFAVLNDMPQRCRDSLATLRLLILGGEALKTEEVMRFRTHSPQVELVNVYGPTETTVLSSAYPVPRQLDPERAWQPLGLPIANTEFWLLDQHDRVCPATVTGTLYIGGDGLGRGYWNDQAKTDAAFRMLAPDGGAARRLYCSGDLARLSSAGLLEFVGRSDNQIKLRGFRIELGEIEATLERHPQVEAAVVKAIARAGGERVLVAYYSGAVLTRHAFDGFLRERLPAYMLPGFYQYVREWPLSANRKVDRLRLSEPDWLADETAGARQAPQGATETALADIWRELTGPAAISRSDNFFLLGGNSLSAVRLCNRIRQRFQRALALSAVMRHPVLADMAYQIEQARQAELAELEVAPQAGGAPDTEAPATEAQARLVFLERSHPGLAMNNIPLTLALGARLDAARLRAACADLAARHPMLRTRFRLDARGLALCFGAAQGDYCDTLVALGKTEALEECRRFHQRPFDLERGPLWRVARIHAADSGRQWLAISLHHAIADGVTLVRLLAELDALYQGLALASMDGALSYQDYGRWLNGQLGGGFGARAAQFWSDPARRAPLPALPARPGGDLDDVTGGELVFSLDARHSAQLRALCVDYACTPFVLMLSLFGFALGQRIEARRFALGVTMNGRSRLEFEQTPGLFVNTLPLAFEWSGQECLADLTARVKHTLVQLQEVEDYPLNRVMSALGQRELPFNILFNEEVLPPAFSFAGQGATLEAIGTGSAKFPLLVSFLFGAENWRWRVEYRAHQIERAWIDGLHGDIKLLLNAPDGLGQPTLAELEALDADLLALLLD
ncbi:fengycin family lipopeptide synthetase D [Oxalobacteraceae bacterium GrIS 1.11]